MKPIVWMRDPVAMNTPGILSGLQDLAAYAKKRTGGRVMVEVGTFAGEAAEVFAEHFKRVCCVDDWKDRCGSPFSLKRIEASFDRRALAARPRIEKHKTTSEEASRRVYHTDMVYIDACHEYPFVLADLVRWWPTLKSGGILAGHDYAFPSVRKAVEDFFAYVQGFGLMRWWHDLRLEHWADTSWSVVKP